MAKTIENLGVLNNEKKKKKKHLKVDWVKPMLKQLAKIELNTVYYYYRLGLLWGQ